MDALSSLLQAGIGRLALATLQSLPLAALVWLLCQRLPRLGANARCWLWWLVSLQLVAGLCWPQPVRLPLLPAPVTEAALTVTTSPRAIPQDVDAFALPAAASPITVNAPSMATATPVTGRAPAWMAWTLGMAWLAGVAAMAWRSGTDLRVTRRRVRASSDVVPPALAAQYRKLTAALGLRHAPPLRLSDQLDSPQLAGVWSPCLLMPAALLPQMSPAAIEMALHHELVHWQRRDLCWGWIPALAQHLFFFHPVAHLAAREYGLAREAACDAAVLTDDRHAPQDYGRLLLQFGVAPRAVAVVGAASPNFILLKRRLTMLQSASTPWRAGALLLVAAVAVIGVMPYRVVAAAPDEDPAERANQAAAHPEPKPVARPIAAARVQPVVAAAPAAKPASATKPTPMASSSPAPAPAPRAVVAVTSFSDGLGVPPAPPAPPAPPVAVPPMPAVAPPAPPAPPEPREPPKGAMRGTFTFLDKGDAASAWVLIEGDHVHAFGTPTDLRDAQAQQKNSEALWWLREGNQRYVVRDPATLAQLRKAYSPLQALSQQQSVLGAKQGELGRAQGELGARQGDLGAKQGAMAARIAQLAVAQSEAALSGKPLSQQRQLAAEREQQALSQQMQALAAEQSALGERQSALGEQQSALGKRQEAALSKLRAEGDRLASEAIASGKAQRL